MAVHGLGGGWLSRRPPFPVTITPPPHTAPPALLSWLVSLQDLAQLPRTVVSFYLACSLLKRLEESQTRHVAASMTIIV